MAGYPQVPLAGISDGVRVRKNSIAAQAQQASPGTGPGTGPDCRPVSLVFVYAQDLLAMRFNHPELLATWPKPNFVDPVTRGPILYVINGIFFALATLTIAIRLYTRVFVRKWVGLDDYLIVFAWLCSAGDMATVFWGYHRLHWDRHIWDVPASFFVSGAETLFAAKIFWTTASTFIRLSILVLYYRLLEHVQVQQYRWVLHINTLFIAGIYMSYLGTTIFACVPTQAYFVWPSPGTCINELYAITTLAALNTFSEAVMAALPIPVLFSLKMESSQRWQVLVLLCLGFFVAAVGVVRTCFVYLSFIYGDLTWYAMPHWVCSEAELCVALICACVPSIRSLFRHAGKALRSFPEEVNRSLTRRPQHLSANGRPDSESSRHNLDPKLSIYAAQAELQLSRSVDVEGIGLDGFGYTVTITAGNPVKKRSLRKRKSAMPEDNAEAEKGEENWQMSRMSSQSPGGIMVSQRKSLEVTEVFEDSARPDRPVRGWDRMFL
ncbi:hypothetical protein E6O75_ATG11385 [Venturia nashicola]|uniref:Rhodopsin domain-containing protein n=1 Tax=Venturia nashicola TaxID=86259 RepID=A0A4Z1NY01_9PEZI|nr:hypothetical protein E6O75_ATG11385 [Venturia nashicola]